MSVPGCPEPETSAGQWQYIPEGKCLELSLTYRDDCTCKRPECKRAVGLLPPKQVPGRKRAAPGDAGPATGVALRVDDLPRPPIVASIDEIWAERCALRSNARPPAAVVRWPTGRGSLARATQVPRLRAVRRGGARQPAAACALARARVHFGE